MTAPAAEGLDGRWPLPASPRVAPHPGDDAVSQIRARLHATASRVLRRDLAAWVHHVADGWLADVETDDGAIRVVCRARSPEDAAQLVVAVITGCAP